jgi:small nuclear ribonucleoprotein (snRNP)-like protein
MAGVKKEWVRAPPWFVTFFGVSFFFFVCYLLLLHQNSSIFVSMFSHLIGHKITVELKNDLQIRGILQGVDQYMNLKLSDTETIEAEKYPHMVCCFLVASSSFSHIDLFLFNRQSYRPT